MKKQNTYSAVSRLQTLAKHLEKGNLCYEPKPGLVRSGEEWISQNVCTHLNGILINYYRFPLDECVFLFYEHWEFQHKIPVLKSLRKPTAVDSAKNYFKLQVQSFRHIFSPGGQEVQLFGGTEIDFHSAENVPLLRKKIAYNIYCYLEKSISV